MRVFARVLALDGSDGPRVRPLGHAGLGDDELGADRQRDEVVDNRRAALATVISSVDDNLEAAGAPAWSRRPSSAEVGERGAGNQNGIENARLPRRALPKRLVWKTWL